MSKNYTLQIFYLLLLFWNDLTLFLFCYIQDMRALCLFLSVPEEFHISESTEANIKHIVNKYNVLKMAESKARLKQELQAKRRKEEKEQEQHR